MIGYLDDENTRQTKYGPRSIRTAAIGDKSGTIKLPLWGSNISKVTKDEFYHITHRMSSIYMGKIQLNTIKDTVFTTIAPFEGAIDDVSPLLNNRIFDGQSLHYHCSFSCSVTAQQ